MELGHTSRHAYRDSSINNSYTFVRKKYQLKSIEASLCSISIVHTRLNCFSTNDG